MGVGARPRTLPGPSWGGGELDDDLVRRYPGIFAQRHLTIQESCMAWGFTCGDGWFGIVDAMCRVVVEHAAPTGQPVPQVAQVKEKFGSLRVYWSGAVDDFVTGASLMAEALSKRTCELTGRPGRMTKRGGYFQTLCPEMALELGAKPVSRGDDVQMAPLSASALTDRYSQIASAPVDVPEHLLDVVDAMLGLLAEVGKDTSISVTEIGYTDNRLNVCVDGGGDLALGIAACAAAVRL